jgi:hypothetical protein
MVVLGAGHPEHIKIIKLQYPRRFFVLVADLNTKPPIRLIINVAISGMTGLDLYPSTGEWPA